MSAHRTAVRRGRPEYDGVIVMGAGPGMPHVLTGLAGITRLRRCTRGVPVMSAFAADTSVQVGQPGVGREANALGEQPRNAQGSDSRNVLQCRYDAPPLPVPGSGSARSLVEESRDEGCP